MTALVVVVVALTLWMAWRLGERASQSADLQYWAPILPSGPRTDPQPQPPPVSPRPG